MTQNDKVVDFLMRNAGMTSMDAFREYGITRLSARIHELRAKGYDIETFMTDVVNRYDEKCRVAMYILHFLPDGEAVW